MTTKITEQNISNLANAGIDWQAVKTSNFTAVAGQGFFVNTASGAVTVTLPSSPTIGDTLSIVDYGGVSATANKSIILAGNGSKILASSVNKSIVTNEVGVTLVFTDSTKGWIINGAYVQVGLIGVPGAPTIGTAAVNGTNIDIPFTQPADNGDATITKYTATANPGGATKDLVQAGSGTIEFNGLATGTAFTFTVTATNSIGVSAASAASNAQTIPNATFTAATGGTVTTSGDYKIHSFAGDGNFVVSTIGSGGAGGPATVSYVVVAGGGGGGGGEPGYWTGGGGGAGGFREGRDITPSYTASPITAGSGLTIAAQTYPITVGAGGSAGTANNPASTATAGSDGANSVFSTITSTGGGGGGLSNGNTSGTVPARYGRPGGSGSGSGGGADNPVGNGNTPPVSPSQGNNGGKGSVPSAGRGGGGGGAGGVGGSYPNPSAGAGVASSITASSVTRAAGGAQGSGSDGPTNTGGGGGSHPCAGQPGAGGKGIVIIRYKFQ